jgi:myo-inositol 2-dehydrogenase/D-chiro-inositol 1-dehydrogenase
VHHARGSVTLAFPSPYLLNAPTELTVTDRGRPAAGIAEGRGDILTCQRVVGRLAADRGLALAGEAAPA